MTETDRTHPDRNVREPATLGQPPRASERLEAVARAAKVWSGQLVDLTARNNLLFYRDLRAGTLNFGDDPPGAVFDLLGGKTVTLVRLVSDESERENALKRARVVHNRSQEHFEERGLETLFLACGMATWTNQRGAAIPAAPVLLCPARLVPRGAAQEECELAITGDAEVNQTLLQALESDFDCRCDPDELMSTVGIDGPLDTPEELDIAFRWLVERAQRVPGFAVSSRFVLATFAYAKLPMVKDLEGSLEAMVRHDLIAALAGDRDAQTTVQSRLAPVDITAPDHIAPADEFLVLDADASRTMRSTRCCSARTW